ncbi:hypothetical protein [Hafnia alvei]|uniref:Uncharacterized protein n=1 Tax=Hafnia alvei ATCC 51873 TaxID=1002364 RepID=G9Y628_HAFAL|nr:hypothetical protein [Hafnia alvei]EHM43162.1 hypothetical protein HMPREF0454_01991 [Hafnia alvei ATCC 51873]QQE44395.1 hypothetical protein I6H95_03520 [Hafnia alvei]
MDGLGVALFIWSAFLSVIYLIILSMVCLGALGGSLKCRRILLWIEAPQIAAVVLFSAVTYWGYAYGGMIIIIAFSATAMFFSLIVALLVSRWLGHPFHLWIVCHIIFITMLWSVITSVS